MGQTNKEVKMTNAIKTKEKTKSIAWLRKLSFDMRFIDESHNGGTTELAQKTLDFYGMVFQPLISLSRLCILSTMDWDQLPLALILF